MADRKSSKVGTLEILVAMGAVVFIFSLVGLLNLKDAAETVVPSVSVLDERPKAVLESAESEIVVLPDGSARATVVVGGPAAQSVQTSSGTALSSGSSSFMVGGGVVDAGGSDVTPTVTGLVVAVATAEVN